MTLGLLTDTVANQMAKKADLSNRKGLEELLFLEVGGVSNTDSKCLLWTPGTFQTLGPLT